ncbi:CYTH domain-containing protein [Parageobacillus thermoglucosidasius]|uniref:CYTH domain-containing protein n=1 Tax=Parageobacillus thermoglucosidasius TaxID=1426 RepID=UPI003B673ACC
MEQEIEIEFKNLLTKEEFDRIRQAFHIADNAFEHQENHYFDTPQFLLKDKRAALRIRVKNGSYTLTLKQTAAHGALLETHEQLTKEEADALLNGTAVVQGSIAQILREIGVPPEQLRHFGTLATDRAQWAYEGGTLFLDHSHYLQTDDYELEYETEEAESGRQRFLQLLASLHIPLRPTTNKIQRLFAKKYEEGEP